MRYIKIFEYFKPDFHQIRDDISMMLLDLNDNEFYTSVSVRDNRKGEYIVVYIAMDKSPHIAIGEGKDVLFTLSDNIYEAILDINSYVAHYFNIKEDGYSIEYACECVGYNNENTEYYLSDLKEFGEREEFQDLRSAFICLRIFYKLS